MEREELIETIRNDGIRSAIVQLIEDDETGQAIKLFRMYDDYVKPKFSYEDLDILEEGIISELEEEIENETN